MIPEQLHELDVAHLSADFLAECRELMPSARASLAAFHSSREPAALQPLRSFFHTISGVAAPVGFPLLGTIAGMGEEFIALLMGGKAEVSPGGMQLLTRGLDEIDHFLQSRAPEQKGRAPPPPAPPPAAVDLRNQKILLVDDDPLSAKLVNLCLAKAGAITLHCKRPQDALAMVRAERPDLILLDLLMPGQDGFETCFQLRADVASERIPIIFLTRQTDAETHLQAMRLGGDDFVTKPFEPDLLTRRVSEHLLKRAREREGALRDRLTGAFNYRYLKQRLGEELAQPGARVSLAMLNLDHFRAFNDAHGRAAGDEVLRSLVHRAASVVRRSDVVARYGGDLLAVVLVDTEPRAAASVMERLIETVRSSDYALAPGAGKALTVSIGMATARSGDTVPSLIERADAALAAAKKAGRDQLAQES